MKRVTLDQLDLYAIGHEIQLFGALYSGKGKLYLIPLPDESDRDIESANALEPNILVMGAGEWEQFLRQTDVLDIEGTGKAVLRKSQRQIDQNIWESYT